MLGQYVVEPLVWTALLAAGLMSVQHVVRLDSGREVEYLTFAFPGIVGILAMRGFSRTIYRCTIDRRWGLLALKIIYGTGPLGYVLGMTALPIVGLWIQMMIAAAVVRALGAHIGLGELLMTGLLSVVTVMFWTSLALLVTAGVKNYQQRDLIVSLSILPLTFSAPIFYQLDAAPRYLRIIGYVNPLTYQVMAMRSAVLDASFGASALLSSGLAIIAILAAIRIIHVAELQPSEH
jgi:ABC-2 type transport system permease protein